MPTETTPPPTLELVQEPDVIRKMELAYASEYSEAKGGNTALDPAMWGIIIDAVAGFAKSCLAARAGGSSGNAAPTGVDYVQAAKRGGREEYFYMRRVIRPALREAHGVGAWRRYDGEAIVASVVKGTAKLEPVTVDRFIQKVRVTDDD